MTNKQLSPVVRAWLKRTDVEPEDARRSTSHVAARVEQTRQRGRWWPLPSFRGPPGPPNTDQSNTDQSNDYQPTSIPASNGHTPTVTGRTQSMFSSVKAITAGALVFAIGGAFLIAQPFDQQGGNPPGAATDAEAMAPAIVTGTLEMNFDTGDFTCVKGPYSGCVEGYGDGVVRYVVTDQIARAEMSDPRLSGSVAFDETTDEHRSADIPEVEGLTAAEIRGQGGAVIGWGTLRIENDAGAWDGSFIEALDVTADVVPAGYYNVGAIELVGAGAYDGLSAVLFMRDSNPDGADETAYTVSWNGIIFPGNLPPDR